jgi:hypothetical protein
MPCYDAVEMSVFNATYVVAIVLGSVGWLWLIFDCVSAVVGF